MPKLYEYFGLVVLFYSNECEAVHVHGLYQGCECRADFHIVDGRGVDIRIRPVKGRKPLAGSHLNDFRDLAKHYSDEIVQRWVDYFVLHKAIQPEQISRRLK